MTFDDPTSPSPHTHYSYSSSSSSSSADDSPDADADAVAETMSEIAFVIVLSVALSITSKILTISMATTTTSTSTTRRRRMGSQSHPRKEGEGEGEGEEVATAVAEFDLLERLRTNRNTNATTATATATATDRSTTTDITTSTTRTTTTDTCTGTDTDSDGFPSFLRWPRKIWRTLERCLHSWIDLYIDHVPIAPTKDVIGKYEFAPPLEEQRRPELRRRHSRGVVGLLSNEKKNDEKEIDNEYDNENHGPTSSRRRRHTGHTGLSAVIQRAVSANGDHDAGDVAFEKLNRNKNKNENEKMKKVRFARGKAVVHEYTYADGDEDDNDNVNVNDNVNENESEDDRLRRLYYTKDERKELSRWNTRRAKIIKQFVRKKEKEEMEEATATATTTTATATINKQTDSDHEIDVKDDDTTSSSSSDSPSPTSNATTTTTTTMPSLTSSSNAVPGLDRHNNDNTRQRHLIQRELLDLLLPPLPPSSHLPKDVLRHDLVGIEQSIHSKKVSRAFASLKSNHCKEVLQAWNAEVGELTIRNERWRRKRFRVGPPLCDGRGDDFESDARTDDGGAYVVYKGALGYRNGYYDIRIGGGGHQYGVTCQRPSNGRHRYDHDRDEDEKAVDRAMERIREASLMLSSVSTHVALTRAEFVASLED